MSPSSRSVVIALLAVCAGAPALSQTSSAQTSSGQTSLTQPAIARAYTVEPFAPQGPIRIQGEGVRLRAEPFATRDTPVLSSGDTGLELTVVGLARMPDWAWYQVILRNGQKAFIRSDLTSAPLSGAASPAGAVRPPAAAVSRAPQAVAGAPANASALAEPSGRTLPSGRSAPDVSLPRPGASANASASVSSALPPVSDPGLIAVAPAAPAPRAGAGQPLSEIIMRQLVDRRCWTDSSAMLDAHRLRATFALSFGTDGKLGAEPVLIDPPLAPADDPPMMVFIAKARAALRTCNAQGFDIPSDYFGAGPRPEVWIAFRGR